MSSLYMIQPEWLGRLILIAERRERSERSEANNCVLFEIPRYLYIYIYIYIYIRAEAARLRRASPAMAPGKKKRNMHDGIPLMALPP